MHRNPHLYRMNMIFMICNSPDFSSPFHLIMFIIFWNKTDLPLMVDTWLEGVNQLTCLKIHPYERCVLHSRTGEIRKINNTGLIKDLPSIIYSASLD